MDVSPRQDALSIGTGSEHESERMLDDFRARCDLRNSTHVVYAEAAFSWISTLQPNGPGRSRRRESLSASAAGNPCLSRAVAPNHAKGMVVQARLGQVTAPKPSVRTFVLFVSFVVKSDLSAALM